MKIDFNNVRMQAILTYDRLCKKLNRYIIDYPDLADEIQEEMDDLAMMLGSIGSSYLPDNDDVRDVYSGMKSMEHFNHES